MFVKSGRVERRVGHPLQLKFSFDPKDADFEICLTPKSGFPRDCLFGLRVWLRVSTISPDNQQPTLFRHRLFSEESFWISRSPNFKLRWEGSFLAQPYIAKERQHVHSAVISGVPLLFIAKLSNVEGDKGDPAEFLISLEYELGGVTRTLCRNIDARITCPLTDISFVIYTIPARQTTTGSMHRLFLWIKSTASPPPPTSYRGSPSQSIVYQRIWKTDSFHITGLTLPLHLASDETIFARPDSRSPMVFEKDEDGRSTGKVIPARRQSSSHRGSSMETAVAPPQPPTSSNPRLLQHTPKAFYGDWQNTTVSIPLPTPPGPLAAPIARPYNAIIPPRDSLGPPLHPYHGRKSASPAFGRASSDPLPLERQQIAATNADDRYDGLGVTSIQTLRDGKGDQDGNASYMKRILNADLEGDLIDEDEEASPSYEAVIGGHSGAFPEEKAVPRR
ncbi:uncharacterized protein EI90DRAFT_3085683 [Cantharellus anzutake]|uniref:uncharacterized protein n=1 Tax=Cantharellus anzutake TaxID=1750568 RepID=UPI00190424AA|nr:uncharacterized protein EI90DRAFT_3085683 [Cantharellus anzutake]KAF8317014.1 hypothetical protein EI90DRAFT_3085683 [Cantharellus anzutake]